MEDQKKLLKVFNFAIADMGWKQSDIMDILGIKQSTASMFMNGNRVIKPIHIKKIANRMGLDSVELIKKYNEWESVMSLGLDIYAVAATPNITTERHRKTIDNFQDKELALEINKELVELEKLDKNQLKEILGIIKDRKFRLEREAAKKRTSNGDN